MGGESRGSLENRQNHLKRPEQGFDGPRSLSILTRSDVPCNGGVARMT